MSNWYFGTEADLECLQHYGVLGMKWGVRKAKHQARKDAKEYARAKMYYGEGAGNRRKFIKNQVAERSKNKDYKAEFDKQLAKQNMDKHVKGAHRERTRNNALKKAKKYAGPVAAAVGTAAVAAHKKGYDKKVIAKLRKIMSDQKFEAFMKANGINHL